MEVGRYPYRDGYIGLVTMYHAVSQRIDVQFSVSADGEEFWRPIPRAACVPNPPLGDYGGGMIWPYPTAHRAGWPAVRLLRRPGGAPR